LSRGQVAALLAIDPSRGSHQLTVGSSTSFPLKEEHCRQAGGSAAAAIQPWWQSSQPLGILGVLADQLIVGGAVYDALIGATALAAGCTLVTFDERAARTYRAVGCSIEVL
jgi:hypothetical protein